MYGISTLLRDLASCEHFAKLILLRAHIANGTIFIDGIGLKFGLSPSWTNCSV